MNNRNTNPLDLPEPLRRALETREQLTKIPPKAGGSLSWNQSKQAEQAAREIVAQFLMHPEVAVCVILSDEFASIRGDLLSLLHGDASPRGDDDLKRGAWKVFVQVRDALPLDDIDRSHADWIVRHRDYETVAQS